MDFEGGLEEVVGPLAWLYVLSRISYPSFFFSQQMLVMRFEFSQVKAL